MNSLVVNCVGNGEIAVVDIRHDDATDDLYLAELVPTSDGLTHRRVNRETLDMWQDRELNEVFHDNGHIWSWNMEAVENLVIGYLNRQSNARVKLREEWMAELTQA